MEKKERLRFIFTDTGFVPDYREEEQGGEISKWLKRFHQFIDCRLIL